MPSKGETRSSQRGLHSARAAAHVDKALFDAETAVDGAMPTVNLTDAETALCAELAAETGLPPLLVSRFRQMWVTREAPFFAAVSEETDTLACAALAELVRSVARVASEKPVPSGKGHLR